MLYTYNLHLTHPSLPSPTVTHIPSSYCTFKSRPLESESLSTPYLLHHSQHSILHSRLPRVPISRACHIQPNTSGTCPLVPSTRADKFVACASTTITPCHRQIPPLPPPFTPLKSPAAPTCPVTVPAVACSSSESRVQQRWHSETDIHLPCHVLTVSAHQFRHPACSRILHPTSPILLTQHAHTHTALAADLQPHSTIKAFARARAHGGRQHMPCRCTCAHARMLAPLARGLQ